MTKKPPLLIKALTYRVLSLAVTAAIGFFLTGSLAAAMSLGLIDSTIKIGLYAAHEAAWTSFSRVGLCGVLARAALALVTVAPAAAPAPSPALRAA